MIMIQTTAAIHHALANTGYYQTPIANLPAFKALCQDLGQVKQYTDVKIDPSKDQFPYISGEVDFHTDNPTIDTIGWFAIQQDADDGAIYILDSQYILDQMPPQQRALLTTLPLKMPSRQEQYHPALTQGNKPHLFYIPPHCWKQEPHFKTPDQRQAILRFHELVMAARQAKAYQSIRIKTGEALFLNNRFMIHGRGPIASNSQRSLLRAFIQNT